MTKKRRQKAPEATPAPRRPGIDLGRALAANPGLPIAAGGVLAALLVSELAQQTVSDAYRAAKDRTLELGEAIAESQKRRAQQLQDLATAGRTQISAPIAAPTFEAPQIINAPTFENRPSFSNLFEPATGPTAGGPSPFFPPSASPLAGKSNRQLFDGLFAHSNGERNLNNETPNLEAWQAAVAGVSSQERELYRIEWYELRFRQVDAAQRYEALLKANPELLPIALAGPYASSVPTGLRNPPAPPPAQTVTQTITGFWDDLKKKTIAGAISRGILNQDTECVINALFNGKLKVSRGVPTTSDQDVARCLGRAAPVLVVEILDLASELIIASLLTIPLEVILGAVERITGLRLPGVPTPQQIQDAIKGAPGQALAAIQRFAEDVRASGVNNLSQLLIWWNRLFR